METDDFDNIDSKTKWHILPSNTTRLKSNFSEKKIAKTSKVIVVGVSIKMLSSLNYRKNEKNSNYFPIFVFSDISPTDAI